ncbi:PLP-dependent aminotransferase family protein [Rhodospirillum sp. A1_3_36]|uniref:MocR-like ectoine utilization transcription factor EhuR n=1 Tax=Rhodospirillum sp. A1_3_36 TaxID=3391666 RepID=UPI0039A5FFFD
MTIWPPDPQSLRRPVYLSLARQLMAAIEAGEIKGGARLPTHRQLAYELGLSVQTVSRAYDELIDRGIVIGEVGRGTFVKDMPKETRTPYHQESHYGSIIECSILKPVGEGIHKQAFAEALAALAADLPPTVVSSFRPSVALRRYWRPAWDWLEHCGVERGSGGLILTNGNTASMTIALMTACNQGDLVVAEEMGHHTLKALTGYLGLRLEGLPVDGEGLLPEALEAICGQSLVKALYLMPTGLNPLASTMGAERRAALVDIARVHEIRIIENDAWGPLQPDRPPPFARLAPERTFYFTGFTKAIMPGLRTGFLVVPSPFEGAAANRHLATNWMATPLVAEIAARWIEDGTALRLLHWQREALSDRNALARDILDGIPFRASPSGMHIWLPLPAPWTEDTFVAHARLHGVAVAPGSSFLVGLDPFKHRGVRVCLGAEARPMLRQGLEILARLCRSQPEPALLGL